MGKASSSKKVARAARAGNTHKGPERRALGFPLAIIAVVLLGTGLVVFSRENRDEAIPPTLNDHWHAAYGIWNCGEWEPQLVDAGADLNGIHTHADGVIHIHPFSSAATGNRATLERFFETTGVDYSDSRIVLPTGTVLDEEAGCEGDPATLKVARWPADDANAEPEVLEESLDAIRFREDREVLTIALVRDGESIPRPESVPTLDNLSDVIEAPTTTLPGETTTTVPGETTTTAPGDTSSTTAAPEATTTTGG
jgi:hypothetical protein